MTILDLNSRIAKVEDLVPYDRWHDLRKWWRETKSDDPVDWRDPSSVREWAERLIVGVVYWGIGIVLLTGVIIILGKAGLLGPVYPGEIGP